MYLSNDSKNRTNFLIRLLVILGSVAAIFVALTLIYKKYNRKSCQDKKNEYFNFDDDDFCEDCDDCAGCCDGSCVPEDRGYENDDEDEDEEYGEMTEEI